MQRILKIIYLYKQFSVNQTSIILVSNILKVYVALVNAGQNVFNEMN